MALIFKQGDIVLFQGDSITDCNRNYFEYEDLGTGYPLICSSLIGANYPRLEITFLNRGISGNRVKDLKERWKEDCIDLKPDWVSILIGINDTWRRYDSNDPMAIEDFQRYYRDILEDVRDKTKAGLIICEPFVLPYPEDRVAWREDLDEKIQVIRMLAVEFGAIFVPLDGLFAQASSQQNFPYWAKDGVHPSSAGHGFIAKHWLSAVGAASSNNLF